MFSLPIVFYNDLSRRKEIFEPLKPNRVSFYVCGPTVYDYFHIGNARPFIVFDSLRRYLEKCGYEVNFVQNFTDIDDKMIRRAAEMEISVAELAERFIAAYYEDADALGIRRATKNPRATHHIGEIIHLIEILIKKGHAYEIEGDVYFDVSSFPDYGKLSKQSRDELLAGARIEVDPRKKNPLDFALWKAEKPGEPSWESPWGKGRPGWHIECSAMSLSLLGETIDIHAGGSDLIFPHHENEIAQTEAATGKPFVRYWLHNGYILINQEKMSKSLGNFLTVREARKKFPPLAIRLFMLGAHYRSPLNFTEEAMQQAISAVERLRNGWTQIEFALEKSKEAGESNSHNPDLHKTLEEAFSHYEECLSDDFNTAGAIGAVFDVIKAGNAALVGPGVVDRSALLRIRDFLRDVDEVLGIIGTSERLTELQKWEIERLIAEREQARKNKDYKRSDEIRQELLSHGIILEDTPQGTRWKKQV